MVRTAASLNASLDALGRIEPGFARVLESHGHPEPRLSDPGVETLLRTIVGQQVSVAAARSSLGPPRVAPRAEGRGHGDHGNR